MFLAADILSTGPVMVALLLARIVLLHCFWQNSKGKWFHLLLLLRIWEARGAIMLCGSIVLSPIWGPVGSQHCWYLKLPPQCVLVCLCSSIIVRAGRTTEAYNAGSPSHGRGLLCTLTMQCTSVKDGQRLESMALSSVAPPPITSMELPFLPFAPTAVYCVRAI